MPAPAATPRERVSSASAAAIPASAAAVVEDQRGGGAPARITAAASQTPKSGSANSTLWIASTGIDSALAATRAGASQAGARSPSRFARTAYQATRPAPTAPSSRLRILAANAAVSTDNVANSGARSSG